MKNLLTRIPRPSVVLAIVAFALYLPGFWWGMPHATAPDRVASWGVDDETPLGPLAEIHNIIEPKPNQNLGYPLMSSFIFAVAYTPYLGYLWLTGKFTAISARYPFGLGDAVGALKGLALIAHFVSVLMGVGIIIAAYNAGRTLWDCRTGILAALFAMVSFPMFYYTRTGNVDVTMLFFTALALIIFACSIARGFTIQRAAWMGVFVGFAVGTKETSFASFLALSFVLLTLHWRNIRETAGWFSWKFWKPPLTGLFAAFLAFGIGSGLFVNHERYFAHVEFARQRIGALVAGDVAFFQSFPHTWEGHIQLAKLIIDYLIDAMTLPGLLIAVLGILWVLRREPLTAIFALPALTYLLILFWSARVAQLRYIMPVAFTLAFFAARAVVYAWGSPWPSLRAGFALLAFGIIGLSLLRGIDLTHAMINDSRYAAAAWLEGRTQSGDSIEFFGSSQKLPPLKSGVTTTRAIEYLGAVNQARLNEEAVEEIRQGWKKRRPEFVLIMPDHSSLFGVPHSATCPPQIYEELLNGKLGYRQAAYFETPPFIPWVQRPALDYPSVNPPIRIFVPITEELAW